MYCSWLLVDFSRFNINVQSFICIKCISCHNAAILLNYNSISFLFETICISLTGMLQLHTGSVVFCYTYIFMLTSVYSMLCMKLRSFKHLFCCRFKDLFSDNMIECVYSAGLSCTKFNSNHSKHYQMSDCFPPQTLATVVFIAMVCRHPSQKVNKIRLCRPGSRLIKSLD